MTSTTSSIPGYAHSEESSAHDKVLFWGCFIALVTTAFGFIARMFLINTWAAEFNLDPAQSGRLAGIGIWPFAASIIGFSLIIDKIGYKVAMIMAFLGHIIWAVMGVSAYYVSKGGDTKTAYQLLYWGSLILALANGTVEAFINPVVATMFSREKTKWLNILHAGWPGGLVIAGMVTIFMGSAPWGLKVGILAAPAVVYFLMLIPLRFPVQERVASGVSYRDMLAEFGILGAIVVGFLVTLQLMDFFAGVPGLMKDPKNEALGMATGPILGFVAVGIAIVVAFGLYTKAMGRLLMFVMVLIMIPLATTEIGTDGWITSIMEGVVGEKFHPGWVLVYTSIIMVILRFFAGPIVKALTPLGLLTLSASLAIGGLFLLSGSTGIAVIFAAATLYGFGKTFFWPTMLGVVAEQTPRGGALTLNAISGLGMLAVGTLGFPYIGALQANKNADAFLAADASKQVPALVAGGKLTVVEEKLKYEIIPYKAINDGHLNELTSASMFFPSQAGIYDQAQKEKKADKNKDGKLDADEAKAMKEADDKAKADAEKPFDKNGDGKLDAEEMKAVAEKNAADAKKRMESWESRWKAKDSTAEGLTPAERAKMAADEKARRDEWLARFDTDKDGKLSDAEYTKAREPGEALAKVRATSTQGALANMTVFPAIMLGGYLVLLAYFKSKGGYKPLVLSDH